jgi:nucleoside-diphosphate-sugar epimerase
MGLSFYTGATGFVGRNLLGALLRETRDDYLVLIRCEKSREIIERHVPAESLDRITYVMGGLRRPGFGLAPGDADLLKKCDTFWHLAASTSFNDRDRDMLLEINVGGTKAVLEAARGARNLNKVYYMGTAFVAGNNPGPIAQDELPPDNGFKNCYEETKYLAEAEVHKSGLPRVILRPSIVLGDSVNGDCQGETRMVYGYILGIHHALCRHFGSVEAFAHHWKNGGVPDEVRLRLVGHPYTVKNLICIDKCIHAILQIVKKDEEKKAYNLVSRNPLYGSDIRDSLDHSLRIKNVSYVGEEIDNPSRLEKFAERLTSPFRPYCIFSDPQWEVDEDIDLDVSPDTLRQLFENFVTNHAMIMS